MNEHSSRGVRRSAKRAVQMPASQKCVQQKPEMPDWSCLEGFVRGRAQAFIQQVLNEEVTALLGRNRSERISAATDGCEEEARGYRNGYGKVRQLSTSIGTLSVRRPRVRGLQERFVSRVLPLFKRHTREVGEMLPQLYLHGLSQGDFDLALRSLLGDGAPLSSSSIGRLKTCWQAE